MIKEKEGKNNKKLAKTSSRKKNKSKLNGRFENDGVDYERELRKIKALEI